jgi:hypothetical protein
MRSSRFLPEPARHTPLPPGADQAAYVDIADTVRRTHGYAKSITCSPAETLCLGRRHVRLVQAGE